MAENKESMRLLETHFDTALDTPDGIKKLRELILTLAMQGKLVPQDPNDQPASELLKEIEAEKKRLRENEGLRTSANEIIALDEEYLGKPTGWCYYRLGNLAKFIDYRGRTPEKVNIGIPLITAKNVRYGFINREPYEYITEEDYHKWMTRGFPKVGDILFTTEAPLGNVAVIDIDEQFALAQRVICFQLHKPEISYFLKWLIMSLPFQTILLSNATGMTATGIRASKLKEIPVPLPPLAEQRRIVFKIDQLMELCDTLEKKRTERDNKRLAVHTSAINRLLTASDKTTFDDSWQFIAKHFNELYSVKQNVSELKKVILQLAVMGKLVPQDPNDQPASELLKEIEAEKKRLIEEGKIKAQKPLPKIKPDEVPYDLPNGWEWVRLGATVNLVSGQHLKPEQYNENSFGIPYYTGPADFGKINPTSSRWTMVERAVAIEGDILLTVKGAGVGKTNVLHEKKAAISRQLMALTAICLDKNYLFLFMRSIVNELQNLSIGIAIPGIGRDDVLHRTIPLPPLLEQRRIVFKIDQLMELCDTLEKQITSATEKQTAILNAVLAKVYN